MSEINRNEHPSLIEAADAIKARLEGLDGDNTRPTWELLDRYDKARAEWSRSPVAPSGEASVEGDSKLDEIIDRAHGAAANAARTTFAAEDVCAAVAELAELRRLASRPAPPSALAIDVEAVVSFVGARMESCGHSFGAVSDARLAARDSMSTAAPKAIDVERVVTQVRVAFGEWAEDASDSAQATVEDTDLVDWIVHSLRTAIRSEIARLREVERAATVSEVNAKRAAFDRAAGGA